MNKQKDFDVLIIGGGIVGAGIFRDLSLHGVNTLLLDKKDFSSQTSQSSSKMLHGGIRYLENFDFQLVWEALHEKNLWLKMAPHLCQELPFCLPVYKESKWPKFMVKAGLQTYDVLSGFENTPHQMLNKEKTLALMPQLRKEGLKGAGLYYDAIVDDTKLTLENLYDGLVNHNCEAFNYHEVLRIQPSSQNVSVECRDTITNETKKFNCKYVVSALGPFTDSVLRNIYDEDWQSILLPSKGSHIWIEQKKLKISGPMVMNRKDGRVVFVIPQRDMVLVGTTEVQAKSDFTDIRPSPQEIEYLLEGLNSYFPSAKITHQDICHSYAGVRPLIKEDTSDKGKTSREHRVFQPHSRMFVIAGGKYTTFRVMAQDISRPLCHLLNKTYSSEKSKNPLRVRSTILPFHREEITEENVFNIVKSERPRTFVDLVSRRLGLFSKSFWRNKNVSFDDFFTNLIPTINDKNLISKEQIENF